ncbi:Transcriptional regulator, XRE family [Streptococcus infantarius subsp. infantarius]|nr:Transcriptional regulator, XRE family [Streptococcus infantarius subsp. infantarius]MCO4625080.1 Transcriptional regulator, XRE family [Streptococcus infantarius subsp. infantarius]MCO4629525.1 Transcriptional regulator, XRE family [Streptococcus infantarius subsp. infantarius]MCO4632485.1 Transcriptional regulator, XRE family [Streptococcus infantarius subsp. infantarius]MCO4633905.1 Transcriptional regulator, XRE family [Streptococcus infantarius subsp. infantarius]
MENNNKIIGEKIRKIRLSKGETMEEFGKRFNTSKGTVNNWEKGRNKPNRANMLKIAQLGGVTVDELTNNQISDYFLNNEPSEIFGGTWSLFWLSETSIDFDLLNTINIFITKELDSNLLNSYNLKVAFYLYIKQNKIKSNSIDKLSQPFQDFLLKRLKVLQECYQFNHGDDDYYANIIVLMNEISKYLEKKENN